MSAEQARGLVQKVSEDADFRAQLEGASLAERRALLEEHGFGDIKMKHIADATPEKAGGEMSDEEFAAVAGAGNTTTIITIVAASGADAA